MHCMQLSSFRNSGRKGLLKVFLQKLWRCGAGTDICCMNENTLIKHPVKGLLQIVKSLKLHGMSFGPLQTWVQVSILQSISCVTLSSLCNLFEVQFYLIINGDIYCIRFWKLNELMYIKPLTHCLAYKTCSENGCCCYLIKLNRCVCLFVCLS